MKQLRLPEEMIPKARVCVRCNRPLFVDSVFSDGTFRCRCSEDLLSVKRDSVLVDVVVPWSSG